MKVFPRPYRLVGLVFGCLVWWSATVLFVTLELPWWATASTGFLALLHAVNLIVTAKERT